LKLRTLFVVGVAILAVLLLVIAGLATYTGFHVKQLKDAQAIAIALEQQAGDLSYISNTYLLYREPAKVAKWNSTYASFSESIRALELDESEQVELVESIRANSERIRTVFEQVVAAQQAGPGAAAGLPFLQLSWSRMQVQNRQIIFDASRLDALLRRRVDQAALMTNVVLLAVIGGFGALLFAGYLVMYRRTIAGISALQAGSEIVGTGDLDYVLPEDRRDELGDLSRAFNKMTRDLKKVGEEYESQRTIATKLQQTLLDIPKQIDGVEFAHLYRSATLEAAVGGDFYDVFGVKEGRIALLIGDVSGHGVEAARIATLVKDVVHAFAHQSVLPSAIIRDTNELLLKRGIPGFVTVFLATLDPCTGSLLYCSAGHPNILIRRSEEQVEMLEAASPPVGVFPDRSWEDREASLPPRDMLFLYTDGAIEARNNGEFFGQTRLIETVRRWSRPSPEGLTRTVLDAVLDFADGVLADDVALLALRSLGDLGYSRPAE